MVPVAQTDGQSSAPARLRRLLHQNWRQRRPIARRRSRPAVHPCPQERSVHRRRCVHHPPLKGSSWPSVAQTKQCWTSRAYKSPCRHVGPCARLSFETAGSSPCAGSNETKSRGSRGAHLSFPMRPLVPTTKGSESAFQFLSASAASAAPAFRGLQCRPSSVETSVPLGPTAIHIFADRSNSTDER